VLGPVYSDPTMYDAALHAHSWLRWLALLLGLLAVARALSGRSSGRRWSRGDDLIGASFTGVLDLQMLIGLVMYFALSPITKEGMRDMGAAMANTGLRFWTVEHPFGMFLALAVAHIGRGRIRKASDATRRHRTALVFFTIALILIVISIPWPGRAIIGRPLFRM
jgi:hypothetical protein